MTLCQPQVKDRLEFHHISAFHVVGGRKKLKLKEAGHRGENQSHRFHQKRPICCCVSGNFERCTVTQPADVRNLLFSSIFVTHHMFTCGTTHAYFTFSDINC